MAKNYLSKRVSSLKPSGIRKFFDIAATMEDVISLGIGEPDFDSPKPIVQAGIAALQDKQTHYTANKGIIPLLQAISEHLESKYSVRYDPKDEIVATVGGSEALLLAISALLNPGDEVILPSPCFVSYKGVVEIAGGTAVEVPSKMENNFVPVPAELEKAITPQNQSHINQLSPPIPPALLPTAKR